MRLERDHSRRERWESGRLVPVVKNDQPFERRGKGGSGVQWGKGFVMGGLGEGGIMICPRGTRENKPPFLGARCGEGSPLGRVVEGVHRDGGVEQEAVLSATTSTGTSAQKRVCTPSLEHVREHPGRAHTNRLMNCITACHLPSLPPSRLPPPPPRRAGKNTGMTRYTSS